nr:helix-turn-helix domain-containing protein [Pseudomonadota bacterium]
EINYLADCAVTYISGGYRIRVPPRRVALFWAPIPHQVVEVEAQDQGEGQINCVYVSLQEFLRWSLPVRFQHEVMHGGFLVSLREDPIDPLLFDRWWTEHHQDDVHMRRQLLDEVELRLRRMALSGWQRANARQAPVHSARDATTRGIAHIEAMVSFIAGHFSEPISVGDVARHVGLHPNYAMTLFKQVIGMSIAAYITRHRLSHAQTLLAESDEKILTIALDCGFASLSRFYEAFRKHFGTTPRAYRAQWREQLAAGLNRPAAPAV